MKVSELRGWIEDALTRQDRDARERGETPSQVTVDEVVDAVWGRLPLEVRRATSKPQVQASLTMITLRHAFAAMPRGDDSDRQGSDRGGSDGQGSDRQGSDRGGSDSEAARALAGAIVAGPPVMPVVAPPTIDPEEH